MSLIRETSAMASAVPHSTGRREGIYMMVIKVALRRAIATALSILALATMVAPAKANLVDNGDFTFTTPTTFGPAGFSTQVDSWTAHGVHALYHASPSPPPFPPFALSGTSSDYPSPDGGNFVASDGGVSFRAPLSKRSVTRHRKVHIYFNSNGPRPSKPPRVCCLAA